MHYSRHNAFTLVEMSLTLVIIGLLAGAVLGGLGLVHAATIRSAVNDMEKYNTAVATFNSKYGGLPGDLFAKKAFEFGFSATGDANATSAPGLRDGNGVIEGGATGSKKLVGEVGLFWQDLTKSALIGGSFTATGNSITTGANVTQSMMNLYVPGTRLRENVSHYLYADAGQHYYYLAAFSTDASANPLPTNAVTPLEAKTIDEKMDDGFPTTGNVAAMTGLTTPDLGAAAANTICVVNVVPPVYNVSSNATGAADNQVCQLRIHTAFR